MDRRGPRRGREWLEAERMNLNHIDVVVNASIWTTNFSGDNSLVIRPLVALRHGDRDFNYKGSQITLVALEVKGMLTCLDGGRPDTLANAEGIMYTSSYEPSVSREVICVDASPIATPMPPEQGPDYAWHQALLDPLLNGAGQITDEFTPYLDPNKSRFRIFNDASYALGSRGWTRMYETPDFLIANGAIITLPNIDALGEYEGWPLYTYQPVILPPVIQIIDKIVDLEGVVVNMDDGATPPANRIKRNDLVIAWNSGANNSHSKLEARYRVWFTDK